MRILIIDDDLISSQYMLDILTDENHVVTLVDNQSDGMNLIGPDCFDVVVLDRHLPGGVDGLEIISEIKARSRSVKILMISGDGSAFDQRLAAVAGADDYLVKPFAFSSFLSKIQRRPESAIQPA